MKKRRQSESGSKSIAAAVARTQQLRDSIALSAAQLRRALAHAQQTREEVKQIRESVHSASARRRKKQ